MKKENNLTIPIVLGTARDGRHSKNIFSFVSAHLVDTYEEASFPEVPLAEYQLGRTYEAWNEHEDIPEIGKWRKLAEEADGYIIVLPEYNHGYPGELKILLDAAFQEYFDKPVMLVGVSSGSFGGSRVVEHIKPVLIELGMKPTGHAVYFSDVGDIFGEDGEASEEDAEVYTERLDKAMEPLLSYARQLREIREK